MRQNRFSVEAALQAPDTTEARPGLRLRIIAVVVVLLFCILGLRLWALQALQAPAAAKAVAADEIRVVPVEPTRGLILDRYGNPLVDNVVTYQITLSRVAAVQNPQVVGTLAALIGQTTAQVEATIADKQYSPYKPVPILSAAPLPDILYIRQHPGEFPGVSAVATTERNYPQLEISGPASAGYPAEHALGYVGTISQSELKAEAGQGYQPGDDYGQSGLELQYQSLLRGTPGSQELEVDPQGQVVGTVKTTPAVAGDNLVTNLDTGLQQVVDNALSSQILSIRGTPDPDNGNAIRKAPNGAAVVLDPQTGAVLALSSYPFYNPNIWVGGISDANYAALQASGAQNDYSIDGELPPGSTFKLTTATAALETGSHHAVDHRRRRRQLHGPRLPRPQLHVARRHRGQAIPRHRSDDGPHRVERRVLLSNRRRILGRPVAIRTDAHPEHGGAVRLRKPDRYRPSQRGVGSGGEPGDPVEAV